MQTENAQVELSNETIDGFLKNVGEKLNDVMNKWKNRMENLEYEFQVAKFDGESLLREKIENIKKLIQEKKINIKEALEKMIEEKQKIETDYQLSLSIGINMLKPLAKLIGSQVLIPMVKDKIQEILNKRQSETYGMVNIGGIIKNIGKKVSEVVQDTLDKGTEVLDKTINELNEMRKDLGNSLEGMVEDGKKIVDNVIDDIGKVTDGVRDKLKDMKNTITGEKYQQPQQAVITDKVGGLVEGITDKAGDIVKDAGKLVKDILDIPTKMLEKLLDRKGGKKPEDGKKTDKSEEKENNIEVSEKEKENNIEVPEKKKENSIEVPENED